MKYSVEVSAKLTTSDLDVVEGYNIFTLEAASDAEAANQAIELAKPSKGWYDRADDDYLALEYLDEGYSVVIDPIVEVRYSVRATVNTLCTN